MDGKKILVVEFVGVKDPAKKLQELQVDLAWRLREIEPHGSFKGAEISICTLVGSNLTVNNLVQAKR